MGFICDIIEITKCARTFTSRNFVKSSGFNRKFVVTYSQFYSRFSIRVFSSKTQIN